MAFGSGRNSMTLQELLLRVSESDILNYYFNIKKLPILINSPLRIDKTPSFYLYVNHNMSIKYIDYATKETGGMFDLLMSFWGIGLQDVICKISSELFNNTYQNNIKHKPTSKIKINPKSEVDLQCITRNWEDYDLEYWKSFGITLEWLKYSDVYPVKYIVIVKNNIKYKLKADKYAYAYVERKEGKITLKIYQPFNVKGFKWSNKHDNSVISLWTKIPPYGDRICICSSLKDALCLWINTGIPAIAVQGEGYSISNTVIEDLKKRFKNCYILFDNDSTGIKDSIKLSKSTGFTNIILPHINFTKDISDLYKSLKNKQQFKEILILLFNNTI